MEAFSGLDLCIKVLRSSNHAESVLDEVQWRFISHKSSFCNEVKRKEPARCIACDLHDLPVICERRRRIFARTCHAGGTEVILPVFEDGALIAMAFLGQFRLRRRQPAALPLLDPGECRRLISLCGVLEAYLREAWRTPLFRSATSRGFRREAIDRFLRRNLKANPSLADLAAHLGLSAARTAHAVKEATGRSFVQLRDELRLQFARGLLRSTSFKVSHIAAECGFGSPQHFHRFFRERAGTTPLGFRRGHRPEA